ncbi:MAG: glycosyl transferase family 4 [Candidatus Bathyarchaeota archaeon]|nr:glycosyl transferase family 4 [Candidatus Bathyarchaeota archaeon]
MTLLQFSILALFTTPLFVASYFEACFIENLVAEIDEVVLVTVILLLSFFSTFFLTKRWIRSAEDAKLLGKDMNKYEKPLVSRSGGIAVALVICFSLLIYIFLKTFYWKTTTHLVEAFAISATVLLAGFIGFTDDILGWKQGLTQSQKFLLTIPIALPLMVINAGHSVMELPLFGRIDFGLVYPLLVVPVGVIGATNGFNLLAGYNGLEAGMGFIIFTTFGITGLIVEKYWISLIALIVSASLLAFLYFNWYPAKVFPGNSFTYSIGALIATIAILGDMERLAVWLFLLYFVEGLLYFRARVIDKAGDVQAFAKPNKDNSLEMPYKKIYDTTHFAVWFLKKVKEKVYEKDIVRFLLFVQFLFALSGLVLLFIILS